MRRYEKEVFNRLDTVSLHEIVNIQRTIKPIRGSTNKLRFIFNDSVVSGEWICTSDLTIVSGMRLMPIHKGITTLKAAEEIDGRSFSHLEYYESFRSRADRAAKLLVALASARLDWPDDEVSLATMSLPDVQRTDSDGIEQTVPSTGYYFRKHREDEFGERNLLQLDIPRIEAVKV